jgi:hypothetical protein
LGVVVGVVVDGEDGTELLLTTVGVVAIEEEEACVVGVIPG